MQEGVTGRATLLETGGLTEILTASKPVKVRLDCERHPSAFRMFLRAMELTAAGVPTGNPFPAWHESGLAIYRDRPAILPWQRWFLLVLERHLARVLDDPGFTLPYRRQSARPAEVAAALAQTVYDSPPWDASSNGLRSRLLASLPEQDPRDPEFYLHLCNMDRLWAAWQADNPARPYLPAQNAPEDAAPHRRNDRIHSPYTAATPTNGQMLNLTKIYIYESYSA